MKPLQSESNSVLRRRSYRDLDFQMKRSEAVWSQISLVEPAEKGHIRDRQVDSRRSHNSRL